MALSDKKQWFLHDMDDCDSGRNGYYEDDVKEAIKNIEMKSFKDVSDWGKQNTYYVKGWDDAIKFMLKVIKEEMGEELAKND